METLQTITDSISAQIAECRHLGEDLGHLYLNALNGRSAEFKGLAENALDKLRPDVVRLGTATVETIHSSILLFFVLLFTWLLPLDSVLSLLYFSVAVGLVLFRSERVSMALVSPDLQGKPHPSILWVLSKLGLDRMQKTETPSKVKEDKAQEPIKPKIITSTAQHHTDVVLQQRAAPTNTADGKPQRTPPAAPSASSSSSSTNKDKHSLAPPVSPGAQSSSSGGSSPAAGHPDSPAVSPGEHELVPFPTSIPVLGRLPNISALPMAVSYQSRTRTCTLLFTNGTNLLAEFDKEPYFGSGRPFGDATPHLNPGTHSYWRTCNEEASIGTGVCGVLELTLKNPNDSSVFCYVQVMFSNPTLGAFKSGARILHKDTLSVARCKENYYEKCDFVTTGRCGTCGDSSLGIEVLYSAGAAATFTLRCLDKKPKHDH